MGAGRWQLFFAVARRAPGTTLEPHLSGPGAPDLCKQKFAANLDASVDDMDDTEERRSIGSLEGAPSEAPGDLTSASGSVSAIPSGPGVPGEAEPAAWRDEISARLSRYRARRKMRPPHYPSLGLPFAPAEILGSAAPDTGSPFPAFEPVSDRALALDRVITKPPGLLIPGASLAHEASGAAQSVTPASESPGAKILEFPRPTWEPPFSPADQLAEPVSERPRILEVPEFAPPPPALGGITIETHERPEAEMRPGIDIPVQSGSLARRMFASAIDGVIIAVATALFGIIFWKVAGIRPPRIQLLGLAAVVPCMLWAAYQYLLIVYAATTPGLRIAGLDLTRFEGTTTTRSLRRWRVLAAWLSAASLGMGYVWVFLDEDALCWHDRITRTYLAPRKRPADGIAR